MRDRTLFACICTANSVEMDSDVYFLEKFPLECVPVLLKGYLFETILQ